MPSQAAQKPAYREGLPEVPVYMRDLPVDPRGFPVPWFTPWDKVEQRWRFDAAERGRVRQAISRSCCWICGKPLFKNLAFVIGPMCACNRITSEPPSHCECATFAVQACPFLVRPRMRRTPTDSETVPPPGIMIERNPGVALIWVTRSFKVMPSRLISVGPPVRVEVWSEGRRATPEEVIESIRTGLPALLGVCGSTEEIAEVGQRLHVAWRLLGLPGEPDQALPEDLRPVPAERLPAAS